MTGNKSVVQIFASYFLFVAELQLQNFHRYYFAIKRLKSFTQLKKFRATAVNNSLHHFQLLLEGQQAFRKAFNAL
jgi:hypothetical protein